MATSKPLKIVRDAKDFLQARANARPNAKLTIRTSATPSPTGPPFEDAEEGLVRRRLPSLLQNLRQAESAPPTRGVHNGRLLSPIRVPSPPRTDPPRRRQHKSKSIPLVSNVTDSPIPTPSAARTAGTHQIPLSSPSLEGMQGISVDDTAAVPDEDITAENTQIRSVATALASALERVANAANTTRAVAGCRGYGGDSSDAAQSAFQDIMAPPHHRVDSETAVAATAMQAASRVETGPWRQPVGLDDSVEWQPPCGMENLFRPDCDYWDDAEDNLDIHISPSPRLPGDRAIRASLSGDGYHNTNGSRQLPLGQRLSGRTPELLYTHALLDSTVSSSSSGPKMAPSLLSGDGESRLEQSSDFQLPAGAVCGEKFSWVCGELLGRGSLGFVHKALEARTGKLMAVKEVDNKLRQSLQNEVDLYKDLKHPRIVSYLGHDYIEGRLYIYLEFMPGNSIAQVLSQFGPLDESLSSRYTHNLLEGLEYLHTRDPPVLHRDIKGANILVGMDRIAKLSDFGCSKRSSGTAIHTLRGSVPWMAPEVMVQSGYGRKADIWSVGCVLIEMTTAQAPWGTFDNHLAAMVRIAMSQETPPVPSHLTAPCRDLIVDCTRRVPQERPNATDLLKYDFVAGSNRSTIDESWD